jgi:hypothetical protein
MWIGGGVLLASACGIIIWRRRVMQEKAALQGQKVIALAAVLAGQMLRRWYRHR